MLDTPGKVKVIGRIAGRLESYLSSLSQDNWSRPSRCDLWEVADVVAHLTGGVERQTQSMERGRLGAAEPPAEFSPPDAVSMSASNAQRDITLRQRLAGGLLNAFVENHARLHQLLTVFGPEDWEIPCWHARRGPIPARDYVDLRLQELVIHDWDIRAAIDPAAVLDPEGARALLPVAQTWLAMTFRPGVKLEVPATYRFDVIGHPLASYDVTADGESFEIKTQGSSPADVTITCDGDSYLLFAYGRLDASGKGGSGRLDVQGNAGLLEPFEQWFKGL